MRWLPDRIRSCLAIVIEDTPNLLSRTANRRWCLPMAVRGSQFLGWPQVGWAPGPETRCPTVAAPDAPRCVACVRPPGTRANHPGAAETFQWRQPVRCRAGRSRPRVRRVLAVGPARRHLGGSGSRASGPDRRLDGGVRPERRLRVVLAEASCRGIGARLRCGQWPSVASGARIGISTLRGSGVAPGEAPEPAVTMAWVRRTCCSQRAKCWPGWTSRVASGPESG